MRCQCGFSCIAFPDDNKVLPFVDPLHVFELLHLPRDTGLEPRRIEILFRQSARIGVTLDGYLSAKLQFLTQNVIQIIYVGHSLLIQVDFSVCEVLQIQQSCF